MSQGKPQLKFERNQCNRFRDNWCHRRTTDEDERMTDDGRILIYELCWHNQAELKKIVKNQKLKISKIQDSTFVWTTKRKSHKKFERIKKCFEGLVAFWSFRPYKVPCLRWLILARYYFFSGISNTKRCKYLQRVLNI